jgi:hypothetical protein
MWESLTSCVLVAILAIPLLSCSKKKIAEAKQEPLISNKTTKLNNAEPKKGPSKPVATINNEELQSNKVVNPIAVGVPINQGKAFFV